MTASDTTISLDQALADLPTKLRVHELAKRAGLTSKEVIAGLAAAGVTVGSASSSVPAADATTYLTALLGVAGAPPAEPDLVAAVESTSAELDPGFFAAPLFLPPAEAKPARRRRGAKATTAETAEPTLDAGAVPVPVEVTEAVAVEVAEVDAEAQETGASRSGRRRRGRSGGRGRATEQAEHEADTVAAPSTGPVAEVGEQISAEVETEGEGASTTGEVSTTDEEEESEQAARRRRRRGRRGRGRVSDGQDESNEFGEEPSAENGERTADESEPSGETEEDEESGEEETGGDGATRRRRRRRRRGGSSEGGADEGKTEDEPDNTVIHVREPRSEKAAGSSSNEVQGVRGSTRLEAKRQRRREGRGTRSRPQILTEAEFLARREAVERVMAVRQRGDLAQVALLEDGVLVEHFVSRAGSESLMGNIYLGKVQNVLPSMEAAFVDIGKGRNAVLYAGEVNWDAAGLAGKARRIETALSGGDTLLVQVSKDPVGQKGARLTTQISLPGRFLVYVPGGGATGISRKLPDTERKRLKSILDRIVPEDAGVIIRTAAEGVAEEELARDVERLKSQWEEISRQAQKKSNAPLLLSAEPDTLIKVVRDLFNSDITRLVLDGDQAYEPVSAYINAVAPELADRVSKYDGPNDVFAAYRIDEQIAKALERKVYLPSGGSLVIDRTEAMTVIDVNTGKYTGSGGNLEETVTKNNLEAAEEVVRQLRLRDIGGIIVVDFIDMVLESNRELVMRRLTECLGRDRTRHQVAEVTSLGLIQMTRKKMGTGLVEAFSEPCPHCHGRGLILHDVPIQDQAAVTADNDAEARSGRNRRGRGRQEAAVAEQPVVKVVAAAVRPPDPRGPKPPVRGVDEHHEEHRPDGPTERPMVAAAAPARGDASFNAPKSRDASDAVSAVLAALDRQALQQAASQPVASQPVAGAPVGLAPVVETTEPTGGRRRGRRAAGRPAGAPTPVTGSAPAEDVLSVAAPEVPVIETVAVPEVQAPEVVEPVVDVAAAGAQDVVAELEAEEAVADVQAAIAAEAAQAVEGAIATVEPVAEPAEPVVATEPPVARKRAPARRRGSRAAGAAAAEAAPNGSAEASAGPPAQVPAAVIAEPVLTTPAVAAPVDGEPVAVKAPARRRRAASRPAGPAAPTS
ncbi:ribonuclease E [Nakamurella panacisegetis]|uniref:Ribonuclease E n=1 Tax=Nakamurella panacisegetis TaxID=1090615 RepID=A0A1H0HW11_9ACTN|nr:translation initiation factor IF-2 N-terminal domain-containing protein [Nakamurella panacisegetis]SDO22931.1 ribonuclease E [Nakamurella panacisegetis]